MKKILTSSIIIIGLTGLFVFSCTYKNNNKITPTYRNQSTGTGANPCMNCVTVTGKSTVEDPATQNSSLQVGNNTPGWIFESCASHPNMFVGIMGSTTIKVLFSGPITSGTYALTSITPLGGQAQIIVTNAPGQPNDITWYSKGGTITVTAGSGGYTVTFSNIQCTQLNYLFPVVTVSGNLVC